MKKMIIALIAMLATLTSCATVEETLSTEKMIRNIESCEHVLDSIADATPFMDTVAEGDSYYELCTAKENFYTAVEAKDYPATKKQYELYIKWYKTVLKESEDLIKGMNAKQVTDSLNK